jgi:CMP-N-acetylneuraminic acid synthetase
MAKKSLGIIHARGGSKRVPLKNIKILGGKPLVVWMIEAALKAKQLDRVIVSTDHNEIARISKEAGAEVPFLRPADIAEDVSSEMVSMHTVEFLEKAEDIHYDYIVTLQPTTPFILPADIDACIQMLDNSDLDSVITVAPVQERPEWMLSLNDANKVEPFIGKWWSKDESVSQNLPDLFSPNGGAYASRYEVLMKQKRLLGDCVGAHIMPLERSLDIDEAIDFQIGEAILSSLKNT